MRLDQEIKQDLQRDIPLPSNVDQKIQDSYQKILGNEVKMNKHQIFSRYTWTGIAAAVCIVMGISSLFFAHPAMAKDIPVIGSIFQKLISMQNHDLLKKDTTAYGSIAEHAHKTESLSNTSTNNGITIQASDTYCDGYNLYFTLSVQLNEQNFKEPLDYIHSNIQILINGAKVIPVQEYLPKSEESLYIGLYQISRNALEDGTFPDAMTVDVAIDQIYAEPSSPDMIPDTINGNWKLQFTVEKEESLSKSNQISAENNGFTITEFTKSPSNLYFTLQVPQEWSDKNPAPLVTNSNGEEISILSGYCTSLEDGSQRFHYTLEYNDDTEFTVQILDKNNATSDSTIPVVAEIPVSMQ